ncbi:CLUMA_CG012824, isoform A [Clunio marinus]|uniref:Large ribosomal subunit protein mL44 n=1 Tax=Clunio marinus TaxID=568069 RepID=A0A1J1IM11_9DIPT|nr:CLUMA_CG012824, isoform A [Clunio marinus]
MSLLRIASKLVSSPIACGFINKSIQNREIHRYVMPTLREIRRRRKILGPRPIPRRSEFIDWNYEAEIYAFGVRLHETFAPALLQQAFVDRSYIVQEEMKQRSVGIETPVLQLTDNSMLVQKGDTLLTEFIVTYLNISLPNFPRDGIKGIYKHLVSDEVLADISFHLGTKDLILSANYPPRKETLAKSLKAVIGALAESSGEMRAYEFIRDLIVTRLNQKDVNNYWKVDNPVELLQEICKEKKLGEPEPRLIAEVGKNTLLAAYHVGFYSNKKMLGSGFGEDITVATEQAALDSLRNFFNTNLNMKPLNFKMPVEIVMKALKKPSVASVEKM